MYILTNKDNVIIELSNTYELDELHRNIKVDRHIIAYGPDEKINVFELDEIPQEIEVQKYCYTENDGFYKNPNYKVYYSDEQRIEALEQMMNEIILGEE